MNLDEFVKIFAAQFENTSTDQFSANTEFKNLDEWDSLTVLSIISMIDEEFEKTITGADLRSISTIEELYNFTVLK